MIGITLAIISVAITAWNEYKYGEINFMHGGEIMTKIGAKAATISGHP